MKNLVTTDWLEQNLESVRVLDGSWHLPNTSRNAFNEFKLNLLKTQIFLI